ncbi:hypothetical protein GCM10023083_45920 [Streptomyces phyllanthi]
MGAAGTAGAAGASAVSAGAGAPLWGSGPAASAAEAYGGEPVESGSGVGADDGGPRPSAEVGAGVRGPSPESPESPESVAGDPAPSPESGVDSPASWRESGVDGPAPFPEAVTETRLATPEAVTETRPHTPAAGPVVPLEHNAPLPSPLRPPLPEPPATGTPMAAPRTGPLGEAEPVSRTPTLRNAPGSQETAPGPEEITPGPERTVLPEPGTGGTDSQGQPGRDSAPPRPGGLDRANTPVLRRTHTPASGTPHAHAPGLSLPPGEFPGPAVPTRPDPPVGPVRPWRSRRRMGIAAAVGVAAVGAVAALLVPAADGGSPTGKEPSSLSPSPSLSLSPSASASASAKASGPAGDPTSPTPTVAGTSRPPSVPAGAEREAGLYAWVPPKGWLRAAESGAEVHYASPDRKQEILANAAPARGDLLEQWRDKEEQDTSKGLDYRRIRLEETTFRDGPAVVWEYTVTAKGKPWHVRLLGFRSGGTSYEISTWYAPDIEDRAVPTYELVRDSFTPL